MGGGGLKQRRARAGWSIVHGRQSGEGERERVSELPSAFPTLYAASLRGLVAAAVAVSRAGGKKRKREFL